MENPRPEKVAVVQEVVDKFQAADAVIITEYRGLTVRDLKDLRISLGQAGGEYHVYKNTLVKRATASLELDLDEQLLGPTALTFVGQKADGTPGDVVTVATPALGTLANRVNHSDKVAPWTYGAAALMRDLARRGLLN